jgi:hypothetical protein
MYPLHREVLGPGPTIGNKGTRSGLSIHDKIRAQQQRALTVVTSGVVPLAGPNSRTLPAGWNPRNVNPPAPSRTASPTPGPSRNIIAPNPRAPSSRIVPAGWTSRNIDPNRASPTPGPSNAVHPVPICTSRSLFPYQDLREAKDGGNPASTDTDTPRRDPPPPASPPDTTCSASHVETEDNTEEHDHVVYGPDGRGLSPLSDCGQPEEQDEEVPASSAQAKGKGKGKGATRGGKGKAGRGRKK